ncbi:fimbrial biogenesis chaperone [Providencia hangzhouensis]|uniref:fimbrial biogenesis chaperone n=1 Tax=Providencia hangzhouensis TaxID=3031799 RepID=UPI0034DDB893
MKVKESFLRKKVVNDCYRALILLFSLITTTNVYAAGGVGLNATRIIYVQGENSVSVGARNNTNINYLAKFSVSMNNDGSASKTPFSVTPPLIKINSGATQDIRIFAQPNSLPTDRESVFYFSATMIPATDGPLEGSAMNIGYNNIIKVFYRPSKLSISPYDAYKNLEISSSSTGIIINNNSPYYISLNKLSVNGVKIDLNMKKRNTMISPFDSFSYITPANGRNGIVKWTVINDLGGEESFSGKIN